MEENETNKMRLKVIGTRFEFHLYSLLINFTKKKKKESCNYLGKRIWHACVKRISLVGITEYSPYKGNKKRERNKKFSLLRKWGSISWVIFRFRNGLGSNKLTSEDDIMGLILFLLLNQKMRLY